MIRVVPDVGAPALVVGVDMLTSEYASDWNEWASYIMVGGAYGLSALGMVKGAAGDFIKNMGIASLPLAARHIRDRVRQAPVAQRATSTSRLALRLQNVAGNPLSRVYQPEFEQAGAHAF